MFTFSNPSAVKPWLDHSIPVPDQRWSLYIPSKRHTKIRHSPPNRNCIEFRYLLIARISIRRTLWTPSETIVIS